MGSTQYLLQYLQKELKSGVQLKQPYSGYETNAIVSDPRYRYSAIMRGAVLHGLGMDLVKERLMRRSYGSEFQAIFKPDEHPESLKFIDDIDGQCRCNTMKWYASKVYHTRPVTILTSGGQDAERHRQNIWLCLRLHC